MTPNFEAGLEEFVITALMVLGLLAVVAVLHWGTSRQQTIVCYRNGMVADCNGILEPWQPGYAPPPLSDTNVTVRSFLRGLA